MIRRTIVGLVLAAGILFPAASTAAQTQPQTPGAIGIGLLEAPVSRENDPRAKLYVVDHVAPGTTISRKIGISNSTPDTQTVNLYAGAASISGGDFIGAEGRTGNDVSSWTSVTPGQVTVPPSRTIQVEATIAVPAGVANGERYGVIWAERAPPPGATGVIVVNRVGIRIYLSVGTGAEPASDFKIETLTAERLSTGEPAVRAQVHNTGGRALDMSGSLELHNGPGGLSAGPFKAVLGTTLGIGQTEPVLVKLDKRLPAGPWNAVITLASGTVQRSAQGTITFPASGVGKSVKANSLGKQLSIFIPLFAIAAALFAAIMFALARRRRHDKSGTDVKADLRRFDRLVQQLRDGTLDPDAEDPELAIKAAIKQAGRAGDKDTEERLKEKLAELRAARDLATLATEPKVVEAPVVEAPVVEAPVVEAPAAEAPVVEAPPAPPTPISTAPTAPTAPAPSRPPRPDMADILAGVAPEPTPEPTRWSSLLDDMHTDAEAEADAEESVPEESELARGVREAAERARKAAEEASARGQ